MGMDKSLKRLRIAYIEDNEHDVIAFKRSFQKSTLASRITHYERAEEALEAVSADASAFDLVVTDYKLPGISGLDLCRELIEREIPLPVVLLTGAGSENLAIDALKLGAYDYIIKDQSQGYLKLLPVVLPTVVRKHNDRIKRKQMEDERRNALESLAASEERFRSVVETATDAIIVVDGREKIIYWNHSAETMFGYAADEIQDQSLNLIIPNRFREAHQTAFRQVVSTGKAKMTGNTVEMTGLRKDGPEFPLELSMASWKIGENIYFTAIVRDITERIYAEMQLAKRTFDLGERIKELDCLYGLSHLVEKHGSSMEKVCQGIVDLIPASWQYPAITCAAISLYGQVHQTDNFQKSKWQQTSNVIVRGEPIGAVEVFYLAEKPEMDEGPFLKEEKSLIDAIASRLGRIIERIDAEKVLTYESNVTAALSELYEPIIAPLASIEEIAGTVLDKARSLTESHYGYVSSIDPDTGDNVSHTLSEMLKGQCRVDRGKEIVFPREKDGRYGGLWGHALNTLKPFFTNSASDHPATRGLPEGHVPIQRFLTVPVMLGEELVGQIALANKAADYTRRELEAIGRVADFYALAIQAHRNRMALREANEELEKRVTERTKTLWSTNIKLEKEVEDRRLAEEKLQQSKAMLQAVFDGISEPLILVDNKCRIKIINKVAADYYGVDTSWDILKSYCYHVFRGRLEPCEGCEVPETVLDGRSITFERPGFRNARRLEQVVIYPIKEKIGAIGDAIIRITDITKAKKIERQLIQSEKMASLGVLVTSIAHEINNPINFISFNVPILKDYIQAMLTITDGYAATRSGLELCNMDYAEFRSDIYKLLDNIDHGSSRINSFVSNLREFSQDSEPKPHKWVDLNQVFERAISICHNKIKKTVQSFVKNIPEHLPEVYTDPYALEQVLINLLVNATQASDKKDSRVKLNVSCGEGQVIIEVGDNGCGMDEETRLRIFDPFFTTKSPAEGTGLGLYVCHNLIRDLGGLIGVESEPGVGSTFKIMLPEAEHKNRKTE